MAFFNVDAVSVLAISTQKIHAVSYETEDSRVQYQRGHKLLDDHILIGSGRGVEHKIV